MPYVTLQEAAQIVNHQTGVDITAPQLIRFAANSGLPLCVLLNERCYSPTKTTRRENKAAELDPDYWSKPHADDVVLDDAYGLYVLPPRHVFDYQSKDAVYIDYVTSLDGLDTFKPGTDVSRDALQITLMHLSKFIEHIKSKQPDTAPEQTHPAPTVEAVTPAPVALVEPATPAPVEITRNLETNDERGIRLLGWRNEEEKRQVSGALSRTVLREEKENPHLKNDRSNLGKLIKAAKEQTTAPKRYGVFTSHKVIGGKRQN